MSHAIGQDLSDRNNCCYFAVCESCFLIATIVESRNDFNNIAYCPRCLEKEKLSLIPISPDEVYTLSH
jgi:hypothetical protein